MSFLIVDDNSVMRRTIRHVIGEFAGEINECNDGAEALSAYRKYQPDWVLMDVEMSEMDGITATRQIKSVFPAARIAIVTSYESVNLRETARKAGASAYILKENLLELRVLLSSTLPQI